MAVTTLAQKDRRAALRERQARVGILRNPNAPPAPPLRRAALTGKWPSLRSSRRAAPGLISSLKDRLSPPPAKGASASDRVPSPQASTPSGQDSAPAVQLDGQGRVAAIDLAALDSLAGANEAPPKARVPFGADFGHSVSKAMAETAKRSRPAILQPESWLEEAFDGAVPEPGRNTRAAVPGEKVPDSAPHPQTPRIRQPRRGFLSRIARLVVLLTGGVLCALAVLQLLFPLS